ncbi:MAG: ABC transporter substrate-binding protein, partial [Caldilineaceae bacterium]|nr:ABC transporter substrate-binding protein [Caldilineaceae bacterium]
MYHFFTSKRSMGLLFIFVLLLSACAVTIVPLPTVETVDTDVAEPNLTPVAIAVGAPHVPVYLNFDLAQALGYFAEEGLAVDLQYVEGGSDAAIALATGAVDFSGNAMDHVVEAQIGGADLRMLMNFLDQPCATLIVRSDLADEIRSPADIAGHTVGVTRLGSATHTLTVFVAAQADVAADAFTTVEVGTATMAAALRAGQIDVAMGVAPYTTELVNDGAAKVLLDLCQPAAAQAAIGGGMPFTGLLTRADVIAKQPDVVQRVVNALVKAQRFITNHSAEEIVAELPATVVGDDATAYQEALAATLPAFSQKDGAIDSAGVARLLQLHRTFGTITETTAIDESSLYDNHFIETYTAARPPSTPVDAVASPQLTLSNGDETATFSLAELKEMLPVATVTVEDLVYERSKTYEGFWLTDLLDQVDLMHTAGDMLLFRAADGYEIRVDMAAIQQTQPQALVAFRDVEAAAGWEPFPKGKSTLTPAPFYLVWSGTAQPMGEVDAASTAAVGEAWSWIYQLTAIEVINFATKYDRLYVDGIEENPTVFAGFKRFTENCLRCHSINLQGGVEGPELNIPQNITEYRDHDTLVAFIKNSTNFRYG